jgi:2-polyprenyl-3-methyl-5-hydroxy-6-metoxy-1,4-benzoquinol methylase
MKPDRGLYELEEERALPWGDPGLFAWHRARYEYALQFADGRRVLDVGCGEGYGADMLADTAGEVVGVDYSPAAIAHARAKYDRAGLRFAVADATSLPESVGGFDLVVCFEVIEHLDDPRPLVESLSALTSPDGVCLISTPNGVVDQLFERVAHRKRYVYHVGLLSGRQLRRLLESRFESVELLGQSERGGALHGLLKALDVFNLRHLIVRSTRAQEALGTALGKKPTAATSRPFRFSHALARQSPALLAVARRPRHAA